jgi:hypothetical protein
VVTAGCREPAPAPTYVIGEEWAWRDAKGGGWSEHVVAEGSIVQIKRNNGDLLYFDKDRVLQKVVKSAGETLTRGLTPYGVIGARSPDFPLQLGKKWQYDVPSRDKAATALPLIDRVTVVACEEVATLAGKFAAFKMEYVTTKRGESPGEKGVAYRWYAPRVKHLIRRQYVPSPWWSGDTFQDYELIRYLSE